jgi:hypothetical protein
MKKISIAWYQSHLFKRDTSQERVYCFPQQADSIASISLEFLIRSRIQGVILDLDNTIISEDDRYLSPGAEVWIEQAKQSGIKLFILSNGKRHYRVKYWSGRLDLPAISPAKKPLPGAFCSAMRQMKLPSQQVLVIGDSRHTDILGAWIVGCPSIQVASLPHPPRWWERLVGQWLQFSYPQNHELWLFDPNRP